MSAPVTLVGYAVSDIMPQLLLLLLALAGAHAAFWGGGGAEEASALTVSSMMQMEPMNLDWEDIECVLKIKDGRRKHLLKGVSELKWQLCRVLPMASCDGWGAF